MRRRQHPAASLLHVEGDQLAAHHDRTLGGLVVADLDLRPHGEPARPGADRAHLDRVPALVGGRSERNLADYAGLYRLTTSLSRWGPN